MERVIEIILEDFYSIKPKPDKYKPGKTGYPPDDVITAPEDIDPSKSESSYNEIIERAHEILGVSPTTDVNKKGRNIKFYFPGLIQPGDVVTLTTLIATNMDTLNKFLETAAPIIIAWLVSNSRRKVKIKIKEIEKEKEVEKVVEIPAGVSPDEFNEYIKKVQK